MAHIASLLLLSWLALNAHSYAFNSDGDLFPKSPDGPAPCHGLICYHQLQLNTDNCQCECSIDHTSCNAYQYFDSDECQCKCQNVEILQNITVPRKTKSSSEVSPSTESKTTMKETHVICKTDQHGCTHKNIDEQTKIQNRLKRYGRGRWPTWQPSRRPSTRPASRQPSTRPSFRPSTRPASRRPSTRPASRRPSTRPASRRPSTRPASRRPSTRPASRRPSTRPASRRPSSRRNRQPSSRFHSRSKRDIDNKDINDQPVIHNRFKRRHRRPSRRPSTRPASRRPSTRPASRRPSTRPASRRPSTRPASRRPSTRPASRRPSTRRNRRPSSRFRNRSKRMIFSQINKWQSIDGETDTSQPRKETITVPVTIPGNTCPAGQRLSQPNLSCKCY